MSKKKVSFPARPCPPAGVDIVSDILRASDEDVLFQLDEESSNGKQSMNKPGPVSSLMVDSFTSQDDLPFSPDTVSGGHHHEDLAHQMSVTAVDNVYRQASQFLQLSERLQDAPAQLREQCEHLQTLGTELRLSIDALKTQTEEVLTDPTHSTGVR